MIKKEVVTKEVEVATDVFCDVCARSCKSMDYDMAYHGFEYMTLEAKWGYGSNHDMEHWVAQVCEKCVLEQLSLVVNFHKTGGVAEELALLEEIFPEEEK